MTFTKAVVLALVTSVCLACSDNDNATRAVTVTSINEVQGGYTVRFEAQPADALKTLNLLGEPLGTLCRHPNVDSSAGLNKIWLYSFLDKTEKKTGQPTRGYAILERGGSLMVNAWSANNEPLNKKGIWTLIKDTKARFGCELPLLNPYPAPKSP